MARRQRDNLVVSLFPFLSILACVIGVLTLAITGLAISQLDNKGDNPEEVKRSEEFVAARDKIKNVNANIDDLKQKVTHAQATQGENGALQKRLARLEDQKKTLDEKKRSLAEMEARKATLQKQLDDNQKQLADLRNRATATQAKLDELTKSPGDPSVTILPGGTGVDLKPTFIECAKTGVVLHDGSGRKIPTGKLRTDLPFIQLLDSISQQDKGSVVFLVRPDGVSSYYTARSVAISRYCRNGKLPVPGQGPIDLSVFARALNQTN